MSDYTDYISTSLGAANVIQEQSDQLVTGLTKASAALTFGHVVPQAVLATYLPAVSSLPVAYNVTPGATPASLLQTTDMQVTLNQLTAFECGTIVPIPLNVVEDSMNQGIDLFETVVRPRAIEAMAKQLDNWMMWGVGRPSGSNASVLETVAANAGGRVAYGDGTTNSSTVVVDTSAAAGDVGLSVYGPGIPSGTTVASVSAGVHLTLSQAATKTATTNLMLAATTSPYVTAADIFASSHDSAADVLTAAIGVSEAGYPPSTAFVSGGWQYRNMAARTQLLTANPVGDNAYPLMLGGLPIAPFVGTNKQAPGTGVVWNALADAVVGDFSQLHIGERMAVTMDLHTEGVVSDSSGVVQYNLMQARAIAMRVSARYSWMVIAPPIADDSFTGGTRSGFGIVINSGAHSGPVGVTGNLPERPEFPITLPAVDVNGGTGTRSGSRRK